MSLHQLRATLSDPHRDVLVALKKSGTPPFALLLDVAGARLGLAGPATFRTGGAKNVRPHYYPAPDDIVPLMDVLVTSTVRLFSRCKKPQDDLLVVAFVLYGMGAIHPLDNGNGRTALDLAQLLLMHRWSLDVPPLVPPADAHTRLSPALMTWELPSPSADPLALAAVGARLEERLRWTSLEDLSTTPLADVAVALWACRDAKVFPTSL